MTNISPLFPDATPAPTQFETLWQRWPNKAKKALAKARYADVVKGFKTRTLDKDSGNYVELELQAAEDEVLAGAKAYLDSQFDRATYRYKDAGRFIPHLATWLNQGRWMDNE